MVAWVKDPRSKWRRLCNKGNKITSPGLVADTWLSLSLSSTRDVSHENSIATFLPLGAHIPRATLQPTRLCAFVGDSCLWGSIAWLTSSVSDVHAIYLFFFWNWIHAPLVHALLLVIALWVYLVSGLFAHISGLFMPSYRCYLFVHLCGVF